jgi:hypothetical protein
MTTKFRCEACNAVEHGHPKTICLQCNLEFTQIRNLIREMSRRYKFSYADLYDGLRCGVNHLIDRINRLERNG